MNQTIKLNPTENTLIGRIKIDSGIVQVICDATNGSFSVALPDCGGRNIEDITLRFVRKDKIANNTVTLNPFMSQKINNSATFTLSVPKLGYGSVIDLTTDGNNWWK